MNSIGYKAIGRSGLLKHILMVRKKVICFTEGCQLFGDNGFRTFRDERRYCNRTIVRGVRFVAFSH